jgi:phosphate transport system substrate-binding protein
MKMALRTKQWILAVILIITISGAGLMVAQARTTAKPQLKGTIRISGAWALYPMMQSWAKEFQAANPEVRIDVTAGGAGKGAAEALGGLVDIGMVSREIHPEEIKKGGVGIAVVKDAVLPTMNAANPVANDVAKRGLTRETFTALWIDKKTLTWGQLAGKSQPGDKVRVYTRSDACGAADTWAKYMGKTQEDLLGTAVFGDPGLAQAVQKDRFGVGYNNLNYAYDLKSGKPVPGLRIIPIDINGNGKIDKSENFYATKRSVLNAIANDIYPSPPARDLNLLTKGKPTGVTREFILWILTDGQKLVDKEGYIQLPKAKLQASLKKLK